MTISDPLTSDPINHPKHYQGYATRVECIDVTRHLPFNLGNAFKYIWRAGRKDPGTMIEDLEKALWYLRDYDEHFPEPASDSFPTALAVFDLLRLEDRCLGEPDTFWRLKTCGMIVYVDLDNAMGEIDAMITHRNKQKGVTA